MNSPERAPTQTPEYTPSTPNEILSPERIEQYRDQQSAALWNKTDLLKGAEHRKAERDDFMVSDLPQMHRDYLAQAGITPDDPRYSDYMALLNHSAIETGNPMGDPWVYGHDNSPSKRDQYTDAYNQLFAPVSSVDVPQATADAQPATLIDRDPAIAGAEAKLATLRDSMVAISTKRQSRLFGNSRKYREIKKQYDDQLVAVAKLKMGNIDRTQMTDSELNAEAISHYFHEQNLLRTATKEKLANTPAGKFGNWLSTGSKMARLGKGALVGAGGVIVGAGIGVLFGGAAVAGLAAGAVATAKLAVSSARGFAQKDNQEGRGMAQLDEQAHRLAAQQHLTHFASTNQDRETLAHGYFSDLYEKDTKEEQEKRRRSARHGIGGAAIGMVIGGTLAYAAGELIDARPDGRLKFGDWSNRSINPDVSAEQPVVPPVAPPAPEGLPAGPTPEEIAKGATIHGSDTPGVAEAINGALGGGTADTGPALSPEHLAAAQTITGGEGWYQTFSESGVVSAQAHAALLHNTELMNQLQQLGVAYPDAHLGGWGIRMTADGRMPDAAVKLIRHYATKSGFDLAA